MFYFFNLQMCGGYLASGSDGGAPGAPLLPHAAALISDCRNERKEIRIGNFSLDGSSHQTGDAAFTPATAHDLHHSRANNDSHNSHKTQHTRVKQSTLCFTQKDTQPSQTCSGGDITPNPTQNRCG
jgi:hypothetical protein